MAFAQLNLAASSDPLADLRSQRGEVRESAWREVYEAHFDRLYRLVCRFGVAPSEVEDVVQQIFVIAHRRIDDVTAPAGGQQQASASDALGPWLRGIAVRVVSDHHRWRRIRRLKQWLLVAGARENAEPPVTPEGSLAALQMQERVSRVLARMSPKLRNVLVLCDLHQCSASETADALRIPLNTVRSRRVRARAAFQRLWDKEVSR